MIIMPSATFLLVLLIMIGASSVDSRKQIGMGHGRGSRTSLEKGKNKTVNICLQNELEGNLFCNCNQGSDKRNSAVFATCYIYSKDMRYDDPVWEHFASQPNIKDWKVQVRPDGLLRFMPTPGLRHLPSVRKFSLQYGTILELKPFIFLNRTDLEVLNLDRNQIIHISPGAFAHLPSLMRLAIDENRITELESGSFAGAPQLRFLNLSRNNISVVHDRAFAGIGYLEELDLSFNEISVLTRDTLDGIPSLKSLNLNYNRLSFIAADTLCLVPKLEKLILPSNEIQEIEPDAFNCVPILRYLDLADNNLKSIEPGTFNLLERLHYLNLKDNRLSTLAYDTIAPVLDNLNSISSFFFLDDNPLECDCRLLWTFDLLKETRSTSIVSHLNSLKCKLMVDLKTDDEDNFSLEDTTLALTTVPPEENFTDSFGKHKSLWKEDTNSARYRKLMNINPLHLPCPQEVPIEPTFQVPLDANQVQINSAGILGLQIISCIPFALLLLLFA